MNSLVNSLMFDNLLSWSAEVSVLAIAAAAAVCALRHSRARLYFWQAILAVALMLPAIVPWKQPILVALPAQASVVLATNGVPLSIFPHPQAGDSNNYWSCWLPAWCFG